MYVMIFLNRYTFVMPFFFYFYLVPDSSVSKYFVFSIDNDL